MGKFQWDRIFNVYIHRDLEAEGISVASIGLEVHGDSASVIVTVDTGDVDDALNIIEDMLEDLGVILYDYHIESPGSFTSQIWLEV